MYIVFFTALRGLGFGYIINTELKIGIIFNKSFVAQLDRNIIIEIYNIMMSTRYDIEILLQPFIQSKTIRKKKKFSLNFSFI